MAPAPKVSVVVPVYNPGAHIDDCIRSLLAQSLQAEEYEVVFVDDGSTDATPARLDALAREHPNVRVRHIPNSGWPGRPRNVGVDLARGEYVYFVDNDDWLGPEALERLHATAVRDDADIVVGKVVGHGKEVPRGLFRRNRSGVSIEWGPLLWLLSPHKLFRRAFLLEHGLRFPEGRRRLEDHLFVVHAYFHTRRISILADYPCYHWVLRDRLVNASAQRFDPEGYFDNLREVLDVVDAHTEPGPFRDRLYARWYRGKMLARLGGEALLAYAPDARRGRYEAIRRLAVERFGARADPFLPANLRLRSQVLREGGYEALVALAETEAGLRARLVVEELRPDGTGVALRLRGSLGARSGPLRFRRDGERLRWLLPEGVGRDPGGASALDVTDELPKASVQLALRAAGSGEEYAVPASSQLRLVPGAQEGEVLAEVEAQARIDPGRSAGGAPLAAGAWEVVGTVTVAGFKATTGARRSRARGPLVLRLGADGRLREGALALRPRVRREAQALSRRAVVRVARRFPGLVRLVRAPRRPRLGGAAR
jgi:poly(ribitol-phosphate) beta-N-acetylglucosaminyltransferase